MEHQLSNFLRCAFPSAIRLIYSISQSVPLADVERIVLTRDQFETKLRNHFKKITYDQFFADYSVDLARIGVQLPEPGTSPLAGILLTEDAGAILRSMNKSKGHVGRVAEEVQRTKSAVLAEVNMLIALGLLDEDGMVTKAGELWLGTKQEVPETKSIATTKKKIAKWKEGEKISWINLRCPRCGYFARTSSDMVARGNLTCPVDKGQKLLNKEERGEKKGRW